MTGAERRPTVIVHDIDHATLAAAASTRLELPVALRSPPGASATLGPLVFQAMIAEARRRHPDSNIRGILDCGVDAGHALAALRAGVDAVRVDLADAPRRRLDDIARKLGRRLDEDDTMALDLFGVADPETALEEWMIRA